MPKLRLKRPAEIRLAQLPDSVRDEIELALVRIQANPEDEGTPLLGSLSGRWRKRVGGYRIVYRIRDDGRLVVVDAIRARSEGY